MIAFNHGFELLVARVHDGDHVHLFVSAQPKMSIPMLVSVLEFVSAKLLFQEFPELKLRL